MKPTSKSRGRGISVINDISEVQSIFRIIHLLLIRSCMRSL